MACPSSFPVQEVQGLDKSMSKMHHDLSRINAHIAKNSELQDILSNENFNLENRIMHDLKDLEREAARLESSIEHEKVGPRSREKEKHSNREERETGLSGSCPVCHPQR